MGKRRLTDGAILHDLGFVKLSYLAQLIWHRAWLVADDYGNFDCRPDGVKRDMFPEDNRMKMPKVKEAMDELEAWGKDLLFYEDGDRRFCHLVNWDTVQHLKYKGVTWIPKPPENLANQLKLESLDKASQIRLVIGHQVDSHHQVDIHDDVEVQGQGPSEAKVTTGVTDIKAATDLTPTDIDDLKRATETAHDNRVAQLSTLYSALKKQLPKGVNWQDLVSAHLREHGENNVMRVYGKALKGGKKISAPDVYFKAAFAEPPPEPKK